VNIRWMTPFLKKSLGLLLLAILLRLKVKLHTVVRGVSAVVLLSAFEQGQYNGIQCYWMLERDIPLISQLDCTCGRQQGI